MNLFKEGLNFFRRNLSFLRESSKLDKWNRSYDIKGHTPNFKVACRLCGEKMIFRYSEVFPKRNRNFVINEGLNHIAYKCPRCHLMYKFFIPDTTEYLTDILENKRDGISQYLPPKAEWEKENKEIKQRLKDLGYM